MKIIKRVLLTGAVLFIALNLLHAQLSRSGQAIAGESIEATPIQASGEVSAQPDSIVQLTAEAQGLNLISPTDLPNGGTFWTLLPDGLTAPFPCAPSDPNVPVYQIAEGQFIVDATGGQVTLDAEQTNRSTVTAALATLAQTVVNLINQVQEAQVTREIMAVMGLDEEVDSTPARFGAMQMSVAYPDALWLEITNVSNAYSYYNLHNATNQVYAIQTKPNLPGASWNIEAELWPTGDQTNVMPFALANNDRPTLFVRAEDWTGVDSDSDGIPDWWAWNYFGTTNVTDTNLDYSGIGYTFAQDYSYNYPPTVFAFTNLLVANDYIQTSSTSVQLAVAGTPYYYAMLIDDNNFSNAMWQPYAGSTLTANLGLVQGWHSVWIGLRGHGDAPAFAVWQRQWIKLDWTPPALVITSPTNGTVTQPMIQLTGFSPEALASISYDLTNAVGLVTNQQVLVLNQTYDTNTWEFTTNTFQAFDVPLTNGVNQFTFHAMDLAGNTTTLVTNFTLSYAGKTNPPLVQILWPTNGMTIAGSNFTVRGVVDDFTATVTASLMDTNGTTNTFNGLVERSGNFWLENLPLSGTNTFNLTITDAAGNVTLTNLTVSQSSVTLTLDTPSDPAQLWQPTINLTGTVSDPTATVIINGVTATVDTEDYGTGTYYWSAENVPTSAGGVAVFAMSATPSGSSNPLPQQASVDKPWRIYRLSDTQKLDASTHDNWAGVESDGSGINDGDESYDYQTTHHYDHTWTDGSGGQGSSKDTSRTVDGWGDVYTSVTSAQMTWTTNSGVEVDTANDSTTTTYAIGLPPFGDEHCVVSDPKNPQPIVYGADGSDDDITTNIYSETYERTAQTVWHVQTGGKALTSVWLPQSVFQISGAAWEVASKRATPALPHDRTIPPQNIQINGKALGSDNIMYQKLPDNADIDVTPYVAGKDFYTFSVGASKHTLTSYTLHPALTDTNRTRLQVGVGEEVSVYLDPPLTMTFPESPTWYVSGGGIDATTGSTTTFTAASNACFAKVTVNVRDVWLNKNFTVLEPSGVDHADVTNTDLKPFISGQVGAGMHLHPYMAPTSVSFYRVQCEEVGEDATNVTGYFTNNPPFTTDWLSHRGSTAPVYSDGKHHGKGDDWFQIQENNLWQEGWDNANAGPLTYSPLQNGGFTWDIPGKWKIDSGPTNNIANGWDQKFTIDSSGTMTITKFGHTVTRHTNETTGTVN